MLRHTITVGLENGRIHPVTQRFQIFVKPEENSAVIPFSQTRHVLKQNGSRSKLPHDRNEALPQVGAGILHRTLASLHKASNL
jgi:hypothetical protein